MSDLEDYRFNAHKLLLELDASTAKMMMMVSASEVEGAFWAEATLRHQQAFIAWHLFLNLNESGLGLKVIVH